MNQSLTHSLYVLSLSELEPDSFMRALTHLHSLKIHSNNLSTANLSSKLCILPVASSTTVQDIYTSATVHLQ